MAAGLNEGLANDLHDLGIRHYSGPVSINTIDKGSATPME